MTVGASRRYRFYSWAIYFACVAVTFSGASAEDVAVADNEAYMPVGPKTVDIATLTVGDASGLAGEEVIVPVTLARNGTSPVSITLGFLYDPLQFEYVKVARGQVAIDAMKDVDASGPFPGNVNFLIASGNSVITTDGVLFNATFGILSGTGTVPVVLKGKLPIISDDEWQSVAVLVLGNCSGPSAPAAVNASKGLSSGILVEWTTVDDATAYIVYRSDDDNAGNAEPISGWLPGQDSYLDTSAEAGSATGRGCEGTDVQATYYYWVRAVNAVCCGSDLAGPAEGYRGGLLKALAGDSSPVALPSLPVNEHTSWAASSSALSVRLQSNGPIDPGSVWGAATAGVEYSIEWLGDTDTDARAGWVVFRPTASWTPGQVISVHAGGSSVDGQSLETVKHDFLVVSQDSDLDDYQTKAANDAKTAGLFLFGHDAGNTVIIILLIVAFSLAGRKTTGLRTQK